MNLHISTFIASCIIGICLLALDTCAYAQKVCFNYRGSWSSWKKEDCKIYTYDDGSGLIFKTEGSLEFLNLKIYNYSTPSKKEIKEHLKNKQWFEYTGTIEYYVTDEYPTAEALAKNNVLIQPNPRQDITPVVKRRANATILVAPYKKYPECYNIWFDNIGVGVDVSNIQFVGQKRNRHAGKKAINSILSIVLFPIGLTSWLWNPI